MKLDEIYKKYKNGEISSDDMVKILLQIIEYKNAQFDIIRRLVAPAHLAFEGFKNSRKAFIESAQSSFDKISEIAEKHWRTKYDNGT